MVYHVNVPSFLLSTLGVQLPAGRSLLEGSLFLALALSDAPVSRPPHRRQYVGHGRWVGSSLVHALRKSHSRGSLAVTCFSLCELQDAK